MATSFLSIRRGALLASGLAVGFWLTGCTSPETTSTSEAGTTEVEAASEAEEDGRKVVLTTFTVLADIAQNVAGDELKVESNTRIGAEIHGYEPTPSDIVKAQ